MSDQTETPKKLNIDVKVSDRFSGALVAESGELLKCQQDGYVPSWMPGGGGDYLSLSIDMKTGQILNWNPNPEELQEWIEGDS